MKFNNIAELAIFLHAKGLSKNLVTDRLGGIQYSDGVYFADGSITELDPENRHTEQPEVYQISTEKRKKVDQIRTALGLDLPYNVHFNLLDKLIALDLIPRGEE